MRYTMRWLVVLLAPLAAASASVARQAGFYPMGGFAPGRFSQGLGVSPDGRVAVGMGDNIDGDIESIRWTQQGGLQGLGMPQGVGFSLANGASEDGTFIVGYHQARSGSPYTAYRWTESQGFQDLGDLAGGSRNSLSQAVSDDGRVVVGLGNYFSNVPEGFVWTEGGGMIGVGDLPGGQFFSQASGVSGDGRVVVGGSSNEVDWGAFRWTASEGIRPLGYHIPEGTYSHAYDASLDGSVIVGGSWGPDGGAAFRWTELGGMASIGELPGGQVGASALAVSADGSIVVGMSDTGEGLTGVEAFFWDGSRGIRRLVDVLEGDYGLDLDGWILERAEGISADGRVIAGYGTNPAGQLEGWVAVIPTPPTVLALIPMIFLGSRRGAGERLQCC